MGRTALRRVAKRVAPLHSRVSELCLRRSILVYKEVIWHFLGSQRDYLGLMGDDLWLHGCHLGLLGGHLGAQGCP